MSSQHIDIIQCTKRQALITAEAAVRIATKKYGGGRSYGKSEGKDNTGGKGRAYGANEGSIWWLNRDLAEKKKKYGVKKKSKK